MAARGAGGRYPRSTRGARAKPRANLRKRFLLYFLALPFSGLPLLLQHPIYAFAKDIVSRVDVYYSLLNLARPIIAFHLFSPFFFLPGRLLKSQGNTLRRGRRTGERNLWKKCCHKRYHRIFFSVHFHKLCADGNKSCLLRETRFPV